MIDIDFRSGQPSDSQMMLKVHTAAILELGRSEYTPEECQSWAHGLTLQGYQSAMARGECFIVAVRGGKIIGFCSFDSNEIMGLFVAPDSARLGVGTRLLKQVEENIRAIGAEHIFLDAALSAVSFYSASGYAKLRTEQWLTRGGLELVSVKMKKRC
ncbi:MAG: GNAT family N-acetyltransferase [Sulfitobacter sp.]